MNIGLTGGIACGKSTVAKMFVRRGALLVDADRIAREVVLPGSPVLRQIVERFGQNVLSEDGSLNRKRLGEIVFNDERARQDLNGIMHPSIRSIMRERMRDYESRYPDKLVVVDVPLLYESGLESMFEEVVVVYVPREVQLRRLMERDSLTLEEAERRLESQWPIEEKRRRADFVINNEGTIPETEQQVDAYLRRKGMQ